ncbi:MAG: type 4a pilus biogenesis protein PilO [Candidatus Margulisiibacteriota bacterium]
MYIRDRLIRISTMLLIMVLGFILYQALITPKRKGINSLNKNLRNIELQISDILGEEVVLRGGAEEEEQMQKFLDKLILQIPSEKDIPRIINQLLTNAGKGLKIEYTLIQPQKLLPKGRYKQVPIELKFITNYDHFKLYLSQLKALPEVFKIETLDMRRMPGQPDHLSVHLRVAAFVIPGIVEDKLDAMGKEPAPPPKQASPFRPKEVKQQTSPADEPPDETPFEDEIQEAPLHLQGIMQTVRDGKPIKAAIINDGIVYVDDIIEGYRVINVKENYVALKKGSKTKILKLED